MANCRIDQRYNKIKLTVTGKSVKITVMDQCKYKIASGHKGAKIHKVGSFGYISVY